MPIKVTRNGVPVTGKVARHVNTMPPLDWRTTYRDQNQLIIDHEVADITDELPGHISGWVFAYILKYQANYIIMFQEDLTVEQGYEEWDDDRDYPIWIGVFYNPAPKIEFTRLRHDVVEKHWGQVISSLAKYISRYIYMRDHGRIEKVIPK